MVRQLYTLENTAGCVTVANKIYCIGGNVGNTIVRLCEQFDPVTEQWTTLPKLPQGWVPLEVFEHKN
jgi:hypothetical protein